jgi:hypothetical protein
MLSRRRFAFFGARGNKKYLSSCFACLLPSVAFFFFGGEDILMPCSVNPFWQVDWSVLKGIRKNFNLDEI